MLGKTSEILVKRGTARPAKACGPIENHKNHAANVHGESTKM